MKHISLIGLILLSTTAFGNDLTPDTPLDIIPKIISDNKSLLTKNIGGKNLDWYGKLSDSLAFYRDGRKNVYVISTMELQNLCYKNAIKRANELRFTKQDIPDTSILTEQCFDFAIKVFMDVNDDNKRALYESTKKNDGDGIFEITASGSNRTTALLAFRSKIAHYILNHYCKNADAGFDTRLSPPELINCIPTGVSTEYLQRDIEYYQWNTNYDISYTEDGMYHIRLK